MAGIKCPRLGLGQTGIWREILVTSLLAVYARFQVWFGSRWVFTWTERWADKGIYVLNCSVYNRLTFNLGKRIRHQWIFFDTFEFVFELTSIVLPSSLCNSKTGTQGTNELCLIFMSLCTSQQCYFMILWQLPNPTPGCCCEIIAEKVCSHLWELWK